MRVAVYFIVGIIAFISGGATENLPLALFGLLAVLVACVLFFSRFLSAIENISEQLSEISDKVDNLTEQFDSKPPSSN